MKIGLYLLTAAALMTANVSHATSKYERFDTDPSQQEKPATIRVLLEKNVNHALLEVRGRHMIYSGSGGVQLSSGSVGKREFIGHDEKGIKWGYLFPNVYHLRVIPGDSQASILVNGNQYRGCVEIYDIGGKLTIVNETDVENFLKSTLNTQFSEEMDPEVMEALAIVARTNTYFWLERNAHARWHVDAKEVNYQGYGAILQNLLVDNGVDSTRHLIMTHNKTPFATAWTKNCAGKTADYTSIFRRSVNALPGVEAPLAAYERNKFRWSFSIRKKELASILGLTSVQALDLFIDKHSNKVYGLRLRDTHGSKDFDFITFQKRVGDNRLRSNDFTVTVKGESIQFVGYGDGVGVGLCLYSAGKLAEHGEKAPKILTAFFPEAQIEKVPTLGKK